jgi:hypothetical protein
VTIKRGQYPLSFRSANKEKPPAARNNLKPDFPVVRGADSSPGTQQIMTRDIEDRAPADKSSILLALPVPKDEAANWGRLGSPRPQLTTFFGKVVQLAALPALAYMH